MGLQGVGFLLQCYLMLAAAMYFDLGEVEEKCIIEEIPEDTLVTGESSTSNRPPESHFLFLTIAITVKMLPKGGKNNEIL